MMHSKITHPKHRDMIVDIVTSLRKHHKEYAEYLFAMRMKRTQCEGVVIMDTPFKEMFGYETVRHKDKIELIGDGWKVEIYEQELLH